MSEEEFRLPPTYREIAEDITRLIDEGVYPYGSRLPSTAVLAEDYGVSEAKIERAVKILVESGTITGRQGLGRYVTRRADQHKS